MSRHVSLTLPVALLTLICLYQSRTLFRIFNGYRHLHCKEPIQKILNKYSQKRNCGPQSQFPHWAIYIFPRSICLFCCKKYVDWSWKYINRSVTWMWNWWNWDRGRTILRKGIHKWVSCCSVYMNTKTPQKWLSNLAKRGGGWRGI
jgi:hypothetical protein